MQTNSILFKRSSTVKTAWHILEGAAFIIAVLLAFSGAGALFAVIAGGVL